jgi:putative Ca2+/H+ antiporter (TMEM165/GDT1 family)
LASKSRTNRALRPDLFFTEDEDEDEALPEKSTHSLFFTTFILITVAEFGDKTPCKLIGFYHQFQPQ